MAQYVRKSILCPNCRKLISSDEPKCPHCGISNPGSWLKNNFWTRGLLGPEQVIWLIIYVNVAMYAISILLNPSGVSFNLFNPFSFLSPSGWSLEVLGVTGTEAINRYHRWSTLLSANYLHFSLIHILFNMIALKQLGPFVLREYGTNRMITIYTLGGVIGFVVSYLAGVTFTAGASAAICALIGAILYYGQSRGGVYGQAVLREVVGWLIGLFLIGLMPGINNWGHGGGVLAGVALGFLLKYQERRRENYLHKVLAGACVVATILILGWSVLLSLVFRFGLLR
jgi:rhomboid protease GluP